MILDHNLDKPQDADVASLTLSLLNECLLLVGDTVAVLLAGVSSTSVNVAGFTWVASISSGIVSFWSWEKDKSDR